VRVRTGIGSGWVVTRLKHKKWNDKWLITRSEIETPMFTGGVSRTVRDNEYEAVDGIPLLKSAKVRYHHPGIGEGEAHGHNLRFLNWKIKKRTFPLQIVTEEDEGDDFSGDDWETEHDEWKDIDLEEPE
jgi:hypothetical protein